MARKTKNWRISAIAIQRSAKRDAAPSSPATEGEIGWTVDARMGTDPQIFALKGSEECGTRTERIVRAYTSGYVAFKRENLRKNLTYSMNDLELAIDDDPCIVENPVHEVATANW